MSPEFGLRHPIGVGTLASSTILFNRGDKNSIRPLEGAGMANMKDFSRGEAECREPSPPDAVEEGGSGQDRRPGPPGASPEEEAPYEARLSSHQTDLSVRPEVAPRADHGPEETGRPAPSGILFFPPQGHDEAQGDHQAGGRSVDARPASRKRGRGRPPKRWVVRVKAIDPGKYPELEHNPENPFSSLEPARRMEEIVSFCAQLWARTCQDITRRSLAMVPATSEKRARAA